MMTVQQREILLAEMRRVLLSKDLADAFWKRLQSGVHGHVFDEALSLFCEAAASRLLAVALDHVEGVNLAWNSPRPCPFCGEADIDTYTKTETETVVQCERCLAAGPVATLGCRDEDEDGPINLDGEALDLWNARAS